MKVLSAVLTVALAFGSGSALAANARNPYGNIDRSNDKGNDTGDSRVDALNQQQLDAARAANGSGGPGIGAPVMQPQVAPYPPPGAAYAAPPPPYPSRPRGVGY